MLACYGVSGLNIRQHLSHVSDRVLMLRGLTDDLKLLADALGRFLASDQFEHSLERL